jgi:PIN domain nuclease of toxin-antitoxin system
MWMPVSVRLWISRLHGCLAADAPAARHQSLAAGALLLPVLHGHVIQTAQLPLVHHDPFDRLLIAQAQVEGLMVLSSDARWPGYDVPLRRPRHFSTVLGTKL